MTALAEESRTRTDGSRTITLTETRPVEEDGLEQGESSTIGALRLHGGSRRHHRGQVEWEDTVVDNEGCGRRSSKICCIYHRQKRFDESSDEESESSDDDDDHDRDVDKDEPNAYERQ